MKMEIKNERRRRDALLPTIGFSLALAMLVVRGIFDVRKLGEEISEGAETTFFWIVRVLCILLIPLFAFLLIKFIKQLFKCELLFHVSEEGIYAKISNKHIYNIRYEDIEKISYKTYPKGSYIVFIFLKDPLKYLDAEQIERNRQARKTIPEAGDIHIPSTIINENRIVVMDLINFFIEKSKQQ